MDEKCNPKGNSVWNIRPQSKPKHFFNPTKDTSLKTKAMLKTFQSEKQTIFHGVQAIGNQLNHLTNSIGARKNKGCYIYCTVHYRNKKDTGEENYWLYWSSRTSQILNSLWIALIHLPSVAIDFVVAVKITTCKTVAFQQWTKRSFLQIKQS